MHLFGCNFCKYVNGVKECDRKNFDNLLWAIVTVFQVGTFLRKLFPHYVLCACKAPQKSLRFLVSARVASDQHVGIFIIIFLLCDVQIAAKIAWSIRTRPRCVLNDFFTKAYERLPNLWGASTPTILCAWEIWSGSNNRIMYFIG